MVTPAEVPLPPDDSPSVSPLNNQQHQSWPGSDSSSPGTASHHQAVESGRSTASSSSPSTDQQQQNAAGDANKARETTVPAACLACRNKHLKCDGQSPCARCLSSQSECIYVASRRGYKGPRRGTAQNPNKRQATSPPDNPDCPMLLGAGGFPPSAMGTPASHLTPNSGPSNMQLYKSYCSVNGIDPTTAERCLDSFYHHFFASHPFVLPREHLLRIAKGGMIEPLLAAIRWVGSIYIDVSPSVRDGLLEEACSLIYDPQRPRDGFLVQSMVLLIVGLDGSCQQERAREILNDVERLALEIDLNTRPFATLQGQGIPVLEESWRRTWWDLFVVDGMVAGVHRVTNFLLFDVPADVALPCEEHQYISAKIPIPLYLEDLEDRDFSDEDREFSSFAYRILCARNLGKFMRTPPIFGPEDENMVRIEALLTNWRLHLPQSKRDALQTDGRLDEMMFQAHMMMHATSILLHQPHSQLDTTPTQDINSCAPHQMVPAGDLFNAHTKHTITSANAISTMITHRVPLLSHTHFFTCVITLSSIVHLSRWALFFIPHNDDDLRQQVRLNIGALNRLAEVWGAADRARGQVKLVAQEIYQAKKQQRLNSEFWVGLTHEDMLNTIATDDSIINEIESLQTLPNLLG
ncbi:fungal zn(2)-Cys(6) binuclear cluster domain-containing protein [Hirsutella rhossiliensis]|uniref:Fungal zn(2)-Cys(6) binuclear cluster domain-containing protein n=1 Tax=Hirsutella rhossiliensis TaxID=111463 RepID=A0A9P8N064_9HYPO|nr:fungal zn(2)-Cys(6) binuclear cluster domain-containing protein [Hirsutella rhossiliensis]KAH0963524.1 fungal zn(2)-Cys(6) binuclear cluster domain-containing protein [Hirsutella rhossiliensis]